MQNNVAELAVSNERKVGRALHILASAVLFVFAMSEFANLIIGDHSHFLNNSVFPFFTNGTVFAIAAIFEATIGILCLRFCGQARANFFILGFIAVIIWYRWAFNVTGGMQCGCAGVFGKLFHLSKRVEAALPIIALNVLVVTIDPWLFCNIRNAARSCWRFFLLFLLLSFVPHSFGGVTIEISGTYKASAYNPRTHQPYMDRRRSQAFFKATINGDRVKICVTNQNDITWWAEFIYDGTNSYTLNPYDNRLFYQPKTNISDYATVSRSPFPLADVEDLIGLSVPWATYGLKSQIAKTDEDGVEIPLPWLFPRLQPQAFGYRLIITPSADSPFIDGFKVVRDKSLDLNDEAELFRPQLSYPDSVEVLDNYKLNIKIRKNIPDGFIEAKYRCLKWYRTNDLLIPAMSKFEYFLHGYTNFPCYIGDLAATSIIIQSNEEEFLSPPSAITLVRDFRYRQANKKRIFGWAQYRLQAGEFWKSDNDPMLLAEAANYLKHGPRYDDFIYNKRRILVWIILLVMLFPPMVVIILKVIKQKKQP